MKGQLTTAKSAGRGAPEVLVAVLANPSTRLNTRTHQQVRTAASVLGFDDVRIVNLFSLPSPSSSDIDHLGTEPHHWTTARENIRDAIEMAGAVLIGFGAIPTSGTSRTHLASQLDWLSTQLTERPQMDVWQVGTARHPSRWHQYLSDKHQRTSGGDFSSRLLEALTEVPVGQRRWTPGRPSWKAM